MANFKLKSDLPQSTQEELARVLAIAEGQRTSVEKKFLVSLEPYIYNEVITRNSAGEITLASGHNVPEGDSGFAKGAVYIKNDFDMLATCRNVGDSEEASFVCSLEGDGKPVANVQASLTTSLTGDNNDIVFTAVELGVAGNGVSIEYVDPAKHNGELAISVSYKKITVHLATGNDGAITTTGGDIESAIEANEVANGLVTMADASDNDGSGAVTAMAETFLEGGIDETGYLFANTGSTYADVTGGTLYMNTGSDDEPTWDDLAFTKDL